MSDNTKCSQECWEKYKLMSFCEKQVNKFIRILNRKVIWPNSSTAKNLPSGYTCKSILIYIFQDDY